jgi:hypothetical protein
MAEMLVLMAGAVFSGMILTQSFMKICQLVQKLLLQQTYTQA